MIIETPTELLLKTLLSHCDHHFLNAHITYSLQEVHTPHNKNNTCVDFRICQNNETLLIRSMLMLSDDYFAEFNMGSAENYWRTNKEFALRALCRDMMQMINTGLSFSNNIKRYA